MGGQTGIDGRGKTVQFIDHGNGIEQRFFIVDDICEERILQVREAILMNACETIVEEVVKLQIIIAFNQEFHGMRTIND
jgi:hypothetical protein